MAAPYYNLGLLYMSHKIKKMDRIGRFRKALDYFEKYKKWRRKIDDSDPIDDYISKTQRMLKRAILRKNRRHKSKHKNK